MLTLLNLLSAVALLIWGTHIVRTGILRVYGSQLRRVLSQNMSKRSARLRRRHRCYSDGAEQ
jgi:phosphate:Na+ symporter